MKIKSFFNIEILGIAMFILIMSCKHEIPVDPSQIDINTGGGGSGSSGGGDTQTCSPDTIYFQNKVLPLLNSGCAMSGCHDAISHKEGINLTTYSKIMSTGGVRAGNPNGSSLYTILSQGGGNRMPPSPYPAFTTEQKNIIYKWIQQGALNNACNDCDTTLFTYSGAVAPLMNTYCKGCHNPSSLGGGIDVSTYASVKSVALGGRLMGSLNHTTGFIAMPQGSNKLSDCKIVQIQKWIDSGTPNN